MSETRILVVDDDFATRLLASEALLADGFTPVEAADGREAIEQFDRTQPHAILLDIQMPALDGYEVCRRIRRRPGGAEVSILVMTASDDVDAVERAFAAGATDFLTKPLNLPLLAHRVRYMLRAAEATAAAREAASRLARVQRLARLVHWQLTADDQFTWSSDPLAVFWPDAPDAKLRDAHLLALVHPDDRDRVAAALAGHAAHELDFRLQFPDGSERIVHQDAELEITDRGVVLIGAAQDVTEVKLAEQQIAQLAFYDDLTGIPNRQFVGRYLRHVDPAVARTAIVIDLGTGQLEGLSATVRDQLIRTAASRVIERVRGADLEVRLDQVPRAIEAYTSAVLVARSAADELIVIAEDREPGSAAQTARRLADALTQRMPIAGHDFLLRPKFGVAEFPDPVTELRRLDDHARAAMADAERTPPRDIAVFTASARERAARRADLAYQLALALDAAPHNPQPELGLDYVARVEPASQRVIGVRARPCWRGDHDAETFAAVIAGDPALRDRLARWTLGQACHDAAMWRAAGMPLLVAIEVLHSQLAAPGFVHAFRNLLADVELEPGLVDLELVDLPTDRAELARLGRALDGVRGLGVRLALAKVNDDCSLAELRRLPLDTLRVERPTLDRLGGSFLATLTTIARALHLRIAISEIDAPAAFAALDPHQPDELAGALFGAAVTAAAVPALVRPLEPSRNEKTGHAGRSSVDMMR
ncbi:MAG TPA: response regulator [Kofleriaceae bacterium]|nr:response regulator [Kofleriaceae bacterium]